MKVQSELRLLLQFYANHGQLRLVHAKTGVPIKEIEKYLETGTISGENKKRLLKPINDTKTAFED